MKTILINSTLFTLLSLGLSGCSGNNSVDNALVTASCTADISTYQTLNSGDIITKSDTLVSDENNGNTPDPELSIFQLDDGTKRVCINSGSATIIHQ